MKAAHFWTAVHWFFIFAVIIGSAWWLLSELPPEGRKAIWKGPITDPVKVDHDNAKIALERMKDWATWLTGLQTGALAVLGGLATKSSGTPHRCLKHATFFALLFFSASIILTTWLLGALPSIAQELVPGWSPANDVYAHRIFSFVNIPLGKFAFLSHLFCLLGVISFACCMYFSFPAASAENSPGKPVVAGAEKNSPLVCDVGNPISPTPMPEASTEAQSGKEATSPAQVTPP